MNARAHQMYTEQMGLVWTGFPCHRVMAQKKQQQQKGAGER